MAVSTRRILLTGVSAALIALTGCGDSDDKNAAKDGGGAGNGGNATAGNGDTSGDNTGGQDEGGAAPMPVADLDDNVAGKGCKSDGDCKGDNALCASTIGGFAIGGMMIGAQPAEGGYCTGPCDDDSNCGAGGVCAGAIGGFVQGSCQKACDADGDCRGSEGYVCSDNTIAIPEGGIPMMPDAGMGGGMTPMIPPQPNTCLPRPAVDDLADGVVGKPCAADADCSGGTCSTTVTQGGIGGMGGMMVTYPGGYCSGACLEDENCGAKGVCVGAISIGSFNNPGTCALGCATTAECGRDGYRCSAPPPPFPNAPAGEKACRPGTPSATATIAAVGGSASTVTGTATFSSTPTGAQLVVTLNNCVDGTYGFRIHTNPTCGNYGAVWATARGTITETITCSGNTGTFAAPVTRAASEAATKWSLDEAPATDVGGHTLLVYPTPIVDGTTTPLACGAITNVP